MRKFAPVLFTLAIVLLVNACSTDIDTNAPYDSRTVVFGILDASKSEQVIKINRTFLGSGNNLDYALIRDSSEYADDALIAVVQELTTSGNVEEEWTLSPVVIDNKEQEPGDIFYAPEQKVYTFSVASADANGFYLDPEREYRLVITFSNGDVVQAQTDIASMEPGNIQTPTPFPPDIMPTSPAQLTFVQNISGADVNYKTQNFKYTSARNGKRYESFLRMTYREDVYADASQTGAPISSTETYVDINLPERQSDDLDGGQSFTLQMAGEDFYKALQNKLVADPKVRRVVGYEHNGGMRLFDYFVTSGVSDFHTYLEVTEPVTGVATDRPTFTNVSPTNGRANLGIFSSKTTVGSRNVRTNNASLQELFNGIHTSDLNFCVDANAFSEFSGQVFACP